MILGKDKLKDSLRVVGQRATASAKEGMREIAVITGMLAIGNAPRDTGALRGSVKIKEYKTGLGFMIEMGGPEAPYAVTVHENLEVHHPIGGPKFLERAMQTVSSVLLSRVGSRVNFG